MAFDYTNSAWIRKCRTSLNKTSYDESNKEYMTDSTLNVISFDKFKEYYLSMQNLDQSLANSADTLTCDDEYTYLIEFKNGDIDNHQIESKLKDSVIILCDEWKRTISNTRRDIVFVLVYNEERYSIPVTDLRAISAANQSGLSHNHFGLKKANLYVKKALIYSKRDFKSKLLPRLKAV